MSASGGSAGCMVCSDPVFRRVVDEELGKGLSLAGLSRLMGMRGYPVTSETLGRHRRHQVEYQGFDLETATFKQPDAPPPLPTISKRDAAIIIKNRLLDAIEARDATSDPVDILDKDLQPALKTALTAQAIEDKREQKKVTQNFWLQLYTGQQGQQPVMLEAGDVIEGEAVEID